MAKVKVVKVRRGDRLAYYIDYSINAAAAPRMAEKLFPKLEWHTYRPRPTVERDWRPDNER